METHEQAVKRGKKSRKSGSEFELAVRKDLMSKGWIVTKFDNDVFFEEEIIETAQGMFVNPKKIKILNGELKQAKKSFNPFTRRVGYGNGFPDFICIRKFDEEENFMKTGAVPNGKGLFINAFEVQLVESKMTGKLDREEKEKIEWIKSNLKIPVFVAKKNNGVEYIEQ